MADNHCTYTDLAGRVTRARKKNVREKRGFFECVYFLRFLPGRAGTKCTPEGISHVLLSCTAMLLLRQDLTRDVVRLCARGTTRELGALVRVFCACVIYACRLIADKKQRERVEDTVANTARKKKRLPTRPPAMRASNPSRVSLETLLSTRSVSADERKKKLRHRRVQQAQESEETEAVRGGLHRPTRSLHQQVRYLSMIHFVLIFYSLASVSLSRYNPIISSGRVDPHPQTKNRPRQSVCVRARLDCV